MRRYGFYVDLFFQIAIGDQAALAMSPMEWIDGWERHPHLMAILRVVQGRVRHHLAEEASRVEAEAKAKGARHGRH